MALYIPHSIFHLARLLYVRPETFGPYCVYSISETDRRQVVGLKPGGRIQIYIPVTIKILHVTKRHTDYKYLNIFYRKSHLRDRGIDGRIILIYVSKKGDRVKTHQIMQKLVKRVMNVQIP